MLIELVQSLSTIPTDTPVAQEYQLVWLHGGVILRIYGALLATRFAVELALMQSII